MSAPTREISGESRSLDRLHLRVMLLQRSLRGGELAPVGQLRLDRAELCKELGPFPHRERGHSAHTGNREYGGLSRNSAMPANARTVGVSLIRCGPRPVQLPHDLGDVLAVRQARGDRVQDLDLVVRFRETRGQHRLGAADAEKLVGEAIAPPARPDRFGQRPSRRHVDDHQRHRPAVAHRGEQPVQIADGQRVPAGSRPAE